VSVRKVAAGRRSPECSGMTTDLIAPSVAAAARLP
jgi:hypothetical protein